MSRSTPAVVRVLALAAFALLVVAALQAAYIATRPHPVAVLQYPQQTVLATVPGIQGPAVRVGENLRIRGTKCNSTQQPVPVTGQVSWVSLDPPGSVIPTGSGTAERDRGCVTREYLNAIPEAVADRTLALIALGGPPCVTWQVSGRETPKNPLYLPETWTTQPFQVCPPATTPPPNPRSTP